MDLKTHWLKIAAIIGWLIPIAVYAHGFGEKYDLPVPMSWIIWASCAVVLLSFLLTPFIKSPSIYVRGLIFSAHNARSTHSSSPAQHLKDQPILNRVILVLSLFLFALTWACAVWGTADALMNFAPTFIWIIWWLGMSFAVVLWGNFWPKIDPWKWSFVIGQSLLTNKLLQNHKPIIEWPAYLGVWPAVFTLFMWCALEIIYPIASMPQQIAFFLGIYSVSTWLGMWVYGARTWQSNGDGFSLYFQLLGICRDATLNMMFHQHPTQRNFLPKTFSFSHQCSIVGLVMILLTSVLFDGIHAGEYWFNFEQFVSANTYFQKDINGYRIGLAGLICLWLVFIVVFGMTSFATHLVFVFQHQHQSHPASAWSNTLHIAHDYSFSLLPLGIAYLIAHNFSSFVLQGQTIIALASDPFGYGWNILGTAYFYPDITFIDAKVTWYVASLSIVIGHVVSIVWAHHIALSYQLQRSLKTTQQASSNAWFLNLPMTLVMLAFTAFSLSIIAEPLTS